MIASLVASPVKLAVGIVLAVLALFGGWRCWEWRRDRQREEYAAAVEAARLDSVRVAQLADSLAAARVRTIYVDTLVIERAVTLWRERPDRPLPPGDTATVTELRTAITLRDAYIDTLETRGAVLVAALDTTRRALTDYRTLADSTIAARGREVAALRRALEIGRPRRRWGLGFTGGYGATLTGGEVRHGPGLTVGLTFSF